MDELELLRQEDLELLRQELRQAIARLDKRHRKVLELRLGLSGHPPMTLEEVGKVFGLSRERIRQIEKEAFSILSLDPQLKEALSRIAREISAKRMHSGH